MRHERSRATVSRQRVKKETKLERGTGSALVLKAKSHMKDNFKRLGSKRRKTRPPGKDSKRLCRKGLES